MHARAHLNGRRRGEQPIVHGIRKLIEEAAPQGAMHDRAGLGMLLDHLQDSLDIREEVLAQPGPRRGIPRVRIRHIVSSECRELDSPDHDPPRCALRLTSSHVRSPTSLTSASLSSSNSRCQSGTGTLSGDAAKLAHASSISRIRSSGGSCSTWSRIGGDAIRMKLLRTSCPRKRRRRAGRLAKRTLARSDGRVVADGGAEVSRGCRISPGRGRCGNGTGCDATGLLCRACVVVLRPCRAPAMARDTSLDTNPRCHRPATRRTSRRAGTRRQ